MSSLDTLLAVLAKTLDPNPPKLVTDAFRELAAMRAHAADLESALQRIDEYCGTGSWPSIVTQSALANGGRR